MRSKREDSFLYYMEVFVKTDFFNKRELFRWYLIAEKRYGAIYNRDEGHDFEEV